ncbi:MAG: DUF1800 domain-containing protein [Lewinellaceae bacterium]|nr:DUF1800 domain-containing protein [Lewinellaceae bacterium]
MSHLDRRAFFSLLQNQYRPGFDIGEQTILPFPAALEAQLARRTAAPPDSGLAPYSGPWTRAEVIHLLRRTLFGPTKTDVDYFLGKTMQQAVNEILNAPYTPPTGPVNDYNNQDFSDPAVPFGQSFLNATFEPTAEPYRAESVRAWWIRQMLGSGRSIREKMTLFWHNHIPVQFQEALFGSMLYRYTQVLRNDALGNFKTLLRDITLDPAMLFYLNGYLNSKFAPDENYAREIQELFVIGKDLPDHFTEDDVKAAARLLTGWRTDGFSTFFFANEHDTDAKQFSAFYGNRLIPGRSGPNAGAAELDDFLDMLFDHPEAARYVCRKLYRFFVFHEISPQTEQNVIEPLAQIFRDNNYDILPVLDTLFKSEHFFDALNRGAVIKSPVDMTIGIFRLFGIPLPGAADLFDNFAISFQIGQAMAAMLQHVGDPPNVAGWQAYYQKPFLDKMWINTGTLPKRGQATDILVFAGIFGFNNRAAIDPLAWAAGLSNPSDVNALIDESLELLFGLPISPAVKSTLKPILLSNLPDEYYWTVGWNLWQADPANETLAGAIRVRLQAYLYRVLQMEEFQLC